MDDRHQWRKHMSKGRTCAAYRKTVPSPLVVERKGYLGIAITNGFTQNRANLAQNSLKLKSINWMPVKSG